VQLADAQAVLDRAAGEARRLQRIAADDAVLAGQSWN
jgi:hypothetical protein